MIRLNCSLALALSLAIAPLAAAQPAADVSNTVVPKPEIVTREAWGSTPDPIPDERRHTPKYVTIHHAGVLWTNSQAPEQFLKNMQAWGKRRPEVEQPPRNTYWPDLAYHFLIAPDGRIFEGRPLEYEPESNTKYDLAGNINVELMGNFGEQRPSREQLESLVRVTAWLMQELSIGVNEVRTHRDAAPGQTECPGADLYRYFEDGQFRKWLAVASRGEEVSIDSGPPLEGGPTEVITETRPAVK